MGRVALLLFACASLCVSCDLHCKFENFKAQYGRSYGTPEEEERRFAIFQQKAAEVDRLNAEHPLAHFALNQFSDLSTAEFRARFTNYNQAARRRAFAQKPVAAAPKSKVNRATLPTTYTSPYLAPILNQGSYCGACWAFCTVTSIAMVNYKSSGELYTLSPQQLIDCDSSETGCDGGWIDLAANYVLDLSLDGGGVMQLSDYPYTETTGTTCNYTKSKAVATLSSFFSQTWDESTMDQTIYEYGAVVTTLNADTLWSYSSGILTSTDGCTEAGYTDHSVVLVGWGVSNGTKYWTLQNSWGSSWGESGFFRLQRGVGACLITFDEAVLHVSNATAKYKSSSVAAAVVSDSFVAPTAASSSAAAGTQASSDDAVSLIAYSNPSSEVVPEPAVESSDGTDPLVESASQASSLVCPLLAAFLLCAARSLL